MAHSGKTMTFATNIVPQEGNTYSLGTNDLKWIIRGSLPLSDITGADDLKAIEAIDGTTGLLKKTAANTWTLDTNTYSLTSHTHSYLSSISWSGDTNLKLKQSVNGAAATDVLQFAAGSNITLTGASGKLTIAGTPDTKNTAGSTNSDSKLYLIGATSQAANPQTYSDAHVFETNGAFSAKTLGVNADTDNNKVTLQWNATDSSLDFVFA